MVYSINDYVIPYLKNGLYADLDIEFMEYVCDFLLYFYQYLEDPEDFKYFLLSIPQLEKYLYLYFPSFIDVQEDTYMQILEGIEQNVYLSSEKNSIRSILDEILEFSQQHENFDIVCEKIFHLDCRIFAYNYFEMSNGVFSSVPKTKLEYNNIPLHIEECLYELFIFLIRDNTFEEHKADISYQYLANSLRQRIVPKEYILENIKKLVCPQIAIHVGYILDIDIIRKIPRKNFDLFCNAVIYNRELSEKNMHIICKLYMEYGNISYILNSRGDNDELEDIFYSFFEKLFYCCTNYSIEFYREILLYINNFQIINKNENLYYMANLISRKNRKIGRQITKLASKILND